MEDINNIAKYVITQCCQKEKAISNMKLQKVLYFIQGKSFFFLENLHLKKIFLLINLG